ncbi:hypothetical protein MIR68_008573 [Amoeboaphelidium protococcarum]|nr:hypothetical protein MIR68_008573 [Amoeboaphelidium protococcarum]
MKIAVFGASGGLGLQILRLGLLSYEFQFKVLVRSKRKFVKGIEDAINQFRDASDLMETDDINRLLSRVEIVVGNCLKELDVQRCIRGVDVVINTVGEVEEDPTKSTALCSRSQRILNDAVKRYNTLLEKQQKLNSNTSQVEPIRRIVVVTSLGCGESHQDLNWMAKMVMTQIVPDLIADKNIQEQYLREDFSVASTGDQTDWVIVRPGGLRDKTFTGKYFAQPRYLGGGLTSRQNVAHFILDRCVSDASVSRQYFSMLDNLRDGDVDLAEVNDFNSMLSNIM